MTRDMSKWICPWDSINALLKAVADLGDRHFILEEHCLKQFKEIELLRHQVDQIIREQKDAK